MNRLRRCWAIAVLVGMVVLPFPASSQTWQAPKDEESLFKWLASDDRIKRPLAANLLWEKFPAERDKLHSALLDMLKSPDKDRRVDAALFLRKHFPEDKEQLFSLMEKDSEVDVRIRLARRFLIDEKDARAVPVLKRIIEDADIRTHAGAESALRAAGGLQEGTGEMVGLEKALAILSAPPDWFPDLKGSKYEYSLRGTVKTMAASWLLANRGKVPADKLNSGLRSQVEEIKGRLQSAKSDKERDYWEGRLPSTLEMLLRNQEKQLVIEHAGAARLIKNKHQKERMESVIKKAEGRQK